MERSTDVLMKATTLMKASPEAPTAEASASNTVSTSESSCLKSTIRGRNSTFRRTVEILERRVTFLPGYPFSTHRECALLHIVWNVDHLNFKYMLHAVIHWCWILRAFSFYCRPIPRARSRLLERNDSRDGGDNRMDCQHRWVQFIKFVLSHVHYKWRHTIMP